MYVLWTKQKDMRVGKYTGSANNVTAHGQDRLYDVWCIMSAVCNGILTYSLQQQQQQQQQKSQNVLLVLTGNWLFFFQPVITQSNNLTSAIMGVTKTTTHCSVSSKRGWRWTEPTMATRPSRAALCRGTAATARPARRARAARWTRRRTAGGRSGTTSWRTSWRSARARRSAPSRPTAGTSRVRPPPATWPATPTWITAVSEVGVAYCSRGGQVALQLPLCKGWCGLL